ncbi:MAG TPA: hypothetical protein PKA05_21895 [Roseiflexaceae bacterium]|nr:hypothetical protein [Roseiflexaceae bacterium]HMP43043.1 hypothetical protein [Roseiflexaceae bacterium]
MHASNNGIQQTNWLLTVVVILITLLALAAFDRMSRREATVMAQAASMPSKRAIVPLRLGAEAAAVPAADGITGVEAELRAAVERANTAFIAARGEADAAALQFVATGAWLAEERAYIGAMRARGETEQWRLLSIEFVEVRSNGSVATVCTREHWSVTRRGTTSEVRYFEIYTLFREGVDWRVSQISYN